MDAVILAAGHGRRLAGLVPQYHKPLMIWNGAPIIKTAVEQSIVCHAQRVVVVVSPQNAAAVCDVLSHIEQKNQHKLQYVVQPDATGPGDALLRGLLSAGSSDNRTLVMMGDNYTSMHDMRAVVRVSTFVVGVQAVPAVPENERFTRSRGDKWVEKIPITGSDDIVNGMIEVWNGPLVIDRRAAIDELQKKRLGAIAQGEELPIGPFLGTFCPRPQRISVDTVDVGIPSMIGGDT